MIPVTINVTSVSPSSEPHGIPATVYITAQLTYPIPGPAPTGHISIFSTVSGDIDPFPCPYSTYCYVYIVLSVNSPSPVGSYTLGAYFNGDSNYSSATSPQVDNFTITPVGQSISYLQPLETSAANGSSFTVAASATSGLPVAFTSGGVCTNSGATYTMSSDTGTCSVIANQSGNGDYLPAPTVTLTVSATQAAQTIRFSIPPPASAAYDSSFTVVAGASSGLPLVYASSGGCSNSGATYTMTSSTEVCTVIVHPSGNTNNRQAGSVTRSVSPTPLSRR